MKLTPESLQSQWNSIGYKDGGFLQINIQHPLEWHIGYQSVNQKTLLLVSDSEIGPIDSSKSMAVSRRRRESDNRWTLSFQLLRNEHQDVFSILCCDIIMYSSSTMNEKEALKLVLSRYKQWSHLLESQHSGLMNESIQKGLIGELLFLNERLAASPSLLMAVQGWTGPAGSDQDFMYADGWYEVKSIGVSAITVTISSLEQLDCSDAGELVIMRIDKAAPEKAGAITLNGIINETSDKLVSDLDALYLFKAKLTAYGYMDLQEYSLQRYHFSSSQRYMVDGMFPRLTRLSVPAQIVSVHYELNLPSLADWLKG